MKDKPFIASNAEAANLLKRYILTQAGGETGELPFIAECSVKDFDLEVEPNVGSLTETVRLRKRPSRRET